MKTLSLALLVLFVFIFSSCTPAVATSAPEPTPPPDTPTVAPAAPTATKQALQSMNMIKIDAPSLANNLVGEPAERTIYVYLPPSYASSEQRYPVVYYLPMLPQSNAILWSIICRGTVTAV
jgi:hypothetical protein